jgi:hypothetical protein
MNAEEVIRAAVTKYSQEIHDKMKNELEAILEKTIDKMVSRTINSIQYDTKCLYRAVLISSLDKLLKSD